MALVSLEIRHLARPTRLARFLLLACTFMERRVSTSKRHPASAGARFRQAVAESQPLQVVGAITAYAARMAEQTGFKAVYLRAAAWPPIRWAFRTWASAPWTMC